MTYIVSINGSESFIIPESKIHELRNWLRNNTAKLESNNPNQGNYSLLTEINREKYNN